jgi:hypothetical protein
MPCPGVASAGHGRLSGERASGLSLVRSPVEDGSVVARVLDETVTGESTPNKGWFELESGSSQIVPQSCQEKQAG